MSRVSARPGVLAHLSQKGFVLSDRFHDRGRPGLVLGVCPHRDHSPTPRALLYRGSTHNPHKGTASVQIRRARSHRQGLRPTNATLAAKTRLTERTAPRASRALRLLDVAIEALRGRQRTRHKRVPSKWRVGTRGRGWASARLPHDDRNRTPSPHPAGLPPRQLKTQRKLRQHSPAARR